MSRYLDPTNDVAFKRLFGTQEHKPLLISFLNAVLNLKGKRSIQQVELLPKEQAPSVNGAKTSILDVKCTDERGYQYVVEMQNKKVPGFIKRSQYYVAHTYVSQSMKGISHIELKPVILLAIANHTLFPKKEAAVSYHKTLDLKTHENDLEDLSYVFIELPKFKKAVQELDTTQDKWIYFFKNWSKSNEVPEGVDEPELIEAYKAMEEFNWTLGEKEAYMKANIALTEEFAIKKEEFEKGEKKGHKKGLLEGLDEGKRLQNLHLAGEMLRAGVSKDQVKKITGLTDEDLRVFSEKGE